MLKKVYCIQFSLKTMIQEFTTYNNEAMYTDQYKYVYRSIFLTFHSCHVINKFFLRIEIFEIIFIKKVRYININSHQTIFLTEVV